MLVPYYQAKSVTRSKETLPTSTVTIQVARLQWSLEGKWLAEWGFEFLPRSKQAARLFGLFA